MKVYPQKCVVGDAAPEGVRGAKEGEPVELAGVQVEDDGILGRGNVRVWGD